MYNKQKLSQFPHSKITFWREPKTMLKNKQSTTINVHHHGNIIFSIVHLQILIIVCPETADHLDKYQIGYLSPGLPITVWFISPCKPCWRILEDLSYFPRCLKAIFQVQIKVDVSRFSTSPTLFAKCAVVALSDY